MSTKISRRRILGLAAGATTTAILADIIIPRTNTPGARDARCHECIDLLLSIESDEAQKRYKDGLSWFEERCKAAHGKGTVQATVEQVTEILHTISDEQDTHPDDLKPGVTFFKNLKDRTIFAYYTSREGHVEELGRPEHIGMETFRGCPHKGVHA